MKTKGFFALFAVFFTVSLFAAGGDYLLRTPRLNRAAGVYKCGEEAVFTGTVMKNGSPLKDGTVVRLRTKWEGKIVDSRDVKCDGSPVEFRYTGSKPGWVYFDIQILDAGGKPVREPGKQVRQFTKKDILYEMGAMFEPEKIRTAVPRPADFDAFWAGKLDELRKLPFEVKKTPLECKSSGVELYAIEVNCLGARPVTAYLAIPKNAKPGTLPLFVDYMGWAYCDTNPATAVGSAQKGAIGIALTWHGYPVARSKEYYAITGKFNSIDGIESRDKWFFRDVYVRAVRALDYAKTLPEWNKRDLVVRGGSLGGIQAITAAALDPQVTLAIISVPAFCEFAGELSGHKRSIPARNVKGELTPEMINALGYFDAVNFTPLIKCETVFCTGFTDELCPPSNVYAAYNNLPAGTKKGIYTNPHGGHYGSTKNIKGDKRVAEFFDAISLRQYPGKH